MGLRLRFNLMLVSVLLVGLTAPDLISRQWLQDQTIERGN